MKKQTGWQKRQSELSYSICRRVDMGIKQEERNGFIKGRSEALWCLNGNSK